MVPIWSKNANVTGGRHGRTIPQSEDDGYGEQIHLCQKLKTKHCKKSDSSFPCWSLLKAYRAPRHHPPAYRAHQGSERERRGGWQMGSPLRRIARRCGRVTTWVCSGIVFLLGRKIDICLQKKCLVTQNH